MNDESFLSINKSDLPSKKRKMYPIQSEATEKLTFYIFVISNE
jgi:hypothetical protein